MIDIGKRIVEMRRAKGLKQMTLAHRAEMCASQLCQIENGRVSPSFQIVERIARALDTDIVGLVSGQDRRGGDSAPDAPRPNAAPDARFVPIRALEPDADKAIKAAAAAVSEQEFLPPCTIRLNRLHMRFEGAGAALADEMRADLGLGIAPVGDLVSMLRFRGMLVVEAPLANPVRSVALWDAVDGRPVAVLNERDTRERRAYRLGYELASALLYVSLGKSPVDETLEQHRFLTDFTVAFLMPAAMVRTCVAASGRGSCDWTRKNILPYSGYFGVSAEAFALRLEELGLIDPALRLSIRDQLRAHYKSHPDDMEPRMKGGRAAGSPNHGRALEKGR